MVWKKNNSPAAFPGVGLRTILNAMNHSLQEGTVHEAEQHGVVARRGIPGGHGNHTSHRRSFKRALVTEGDVTSHVSLMEFLGAA